jgi:hypothetical protein
VNRPPVDPATIWTALALGAEPSPPPPGLRERILASADLAAPYRPHLPAFAGCFDLSDAQVLRLLERMGDPAEWTPGLGATIAFLHFEAGPRCDFGGALAHCGVARMRDGARIPRHVHKGREVNFVLRGELVDGEGRRVGPGQVLDSAPGSRHSLAIRGEPEALLAVMLPEVEIPPAT